MRRRITAMAVATTSMVVIAFLFPLALVFRSATEDHVLADASTRVESLIPVLATTADIDERAAQLEDADRQTPGELTLLMGDGRVVGDAPWPAGADSLALAREGRAFRESTNGGFDLFYPIVEADGTTTVLRVSVTGSELHSGVLGAWLALGLIGAALIATAGVVADRMAASISRPLLSTSAVATRLAAGDLDARADAEDGAPEVRAVGVALNDLAERITELLQSERESLADLSHELRTPLTALRLQVEQLGTGRDQQRVAHAVARVEDAVSAMIEKVRDPPRPAGNGDLGAVVRARCRYWSVLAQAQARPMTFHGDSGTMLVRAPRQDIETALDALVGNVFDHTPARCPLQISVSGDEHYGYLVVDDAGPGSAPDEPAGRGKPGDASRGTGLGLDIARGIASRAGGQLKIEPGAAGGTRVVVAFGRAVGRTT